MEAPKPEIKTIIPKKEPIYIRRWFIIAASLSVGITIGLMIGRKTKK